MSGLLAFGHFTFIIWRAISYEYKNPAAFGSYIDWKEETDEIIAKLEEAGKNLGYSLEANKIVFRGDEFTDKALQKISAYLSGKGLTLLSLNTFSDSYHLFIIPDECCGRFISLAEEAGFRFDKFTDDSELE
ncbi:hypothetical protein FACS189475_01160 [Betaproteobacteria bacterium]|nr:hypothetical protein FACS189475_01160 [Betaproteobacteria bacterium]